MHHQHRFMAICSLGLAFILSGCERSRENRQVEMSSESRSDPILKTDDDARTIVGKAVKAHGGEKSFTCWSCGYLKYKTKGELIPTRSGEAISEDTFQLPGYFKRVTRIADVEDGSMVFVVDHGKCWTRKGDRPAELTDNAFTERTEHTFAAFCNLFALTEAEIRLTKLGTQTINGEAAVVVRVQSETLGEVDFSFGSQQGLLLKSRKSLPSEDPTWTSVAEAFLGGYQDVQGVQVPMRIKTTQDGKAILDITLIEVRFADKFEEGTFAKP